jgi:hypothetical protein
MGTEDSGFSMTDNDEEKPEKRKPDFSVSAF